MTEVVALQGWPGAGKSTFARAWLAEDSEHRARVSRDDLRKTLFDVEGICTQDQENQITKIINEQIAYLVKSGFDVLVDATNLRMKAVRELATVANKAGARFVTFPINTSVSECILRDSDRRLKGERFVGEEVIRNFAQRFPRKNWPVLNESPNQVVPKQYTGTPGMPLAVTVDIDGTIANHIGIRSPYDESLYHLDKAHPEIVRLVHALYNAGYYVIFLSGRMEDYYDVTLQWLQNNLRVPVQDLVMRKSGDLRNDAIIKPELFWAFVAPDYDVKLHVDDRQRVVDAMREIGLPVLQCRPGDF